MPIKSETIASPTVPVGPPSGPTPGWTSAWQWLDRWTPWVCVAFYTVVIAMIFIKVTVPD